jgi:NAD(P)H-flavin reductase
MAQDLVHPGSYIFLRKENTIAFYDTPISVMDVDLEENIIKVVIEGKGIKTKELWSLKENDKVLLRGPYWNGVLGLKNIYKCRDSNVLLIARGIGQAPLIPVMKKLYSNGNNIFVILDTVNYNDTFIQEYLNMCSAKVMKVPILTKGELTEEFKKLLNENINKENIKLIHVDAQDIIIYELLEFIENNEVKITCCNNAKMCCGEGICGTCSVRYKGHVVKRLCKLQTEPEYIFKDRRLI